MNTALDAHEIQDILKYVVENNQKLNKEGKKSIAIEVFGEAGCAKSSVVEQVAIESEMPFVKINAAQITVDDFVGYPLKEYKMCKGEECEWVVESAIDTYTAMGFKYSNDHRMGYAIPKWIMGQDKPMIFLIDDYSRASLPVLQAINEVVDRQEYLSWELPKGSTVILTANPDTGDYFVSSTDSAMDTRKLKLEMKFSTEVWASWAEKYGVDSRC